MINAVWVGGYPFTVNQFKQLTIILMINC